MRRSHPEVIVLESAENLGFAAACNRGGWYGMGRYVLLLNSNLRLLPGALEQLVLCMDRSHACGRFHP
ncbi:MAG: glycosyltransferase [Candidatus Sericytochromatia bacterium]|nr:glycosyltransferase [Candidatus Tanganyikabacteria bacterium]